MRGAMSRVYVSKLQVEDKGGFTKKIEKRGTNQRFKVKSVWKGNGSCCQMKVIGLGMEGGNAQTLKLSETDCRKSSDCSRA